MILPWLDLLPSTGLFLLRQITLNVLFEIFHAHARTLTLCLKRCRYMYLYTVLTNALHRMPKFKTIQDYHCSDFLLVILLGVVAFYSDFCLAPLPSWFYVPELNKFTSPSFIRFNIKHSFLFRYIICKCYCIVRCKLK